MTQIYIHTYGRADEQVTWGALPAALRAKTTLVVQHRERKLYENDYPVAVLPKHIQTLSPTRHYIAHKLHDCADGEGFVMMDDDLRFCVRRDDDNTKFRPAAGKDLTAMFKAIFSHLKKHAHVGICAREGGNRLTDGDVTCTRMMRLLGYHAPTVRKVGVDFGRLPFQQDFDATLQLLRAGYPNLVLATWANDQARSDAPGGVSSYRTLDKLAENARRLAALHAPFVTVVTKSTKTAWGGGERLDVRVQWKKAYESAGR